MSKRYAGTAKQTEILEKVLAAADDGRDIEFHELRAALSYGPDVTKQALQYSIRYLEQHGLIVRKYDDRRCLIAPTLFAYQMLRPTPVASFTPTSGAASL